MLNTRNVKQIIAKETKEVQGKAPESTTTKSGRQMEESVIHTEPSLRAFTKGESVPENFFLTPLTKPTSSSWYKAVPVGRNTLVKMMQKIASIACLDGKFTNYTDRKTVIQSLREEINPLEISELLGHADTNSIANYIHNPAEKQRRMSKKLAGFAPSATITVKHAGNTSSTSPSISPGVVANSSTAALPPVVQSRVLDESSYSESSIKALGGLFTGVTFNSSTFSSLP